MKFQKEWRFLRTQQEMFPFCTNLLTPPETGFLKKSTNIRKTVFHIMLISIQLLTWIIQPRIQKVFLWYCKQLSWCLSNFKKKCVPLDSTPLNVVAKNEWRTFFFFFKNKRINMAIVYLLTIINTSLNITITLVNNFCIKIYSERKNIQTSKNVHEMTLPYRPLQAIWMVSNQACELISIVPLNSNRVQVLECVLHSIVHFSSIRRKYSTKM